jgi:hypothetical protein
MQMDRASATGHSHIPGFVGKVFEYQSGFHHLLPKHRTRNNNDLRSGNSLIGAMRPGSLPLSGSFQSCY